MNPYEANLTNTAARLGAWVRGMTRRYRQALLAVAAAGAVMAIGVSATRAPAQPPLVPGHSPQVLPTIEANAAR